MRQAAQTRSGRGGWCGGWDGARRSAGWGGRGSAARGTLLAAGRAVSIGLVGLMVSAGCQEKFTARPAEPAPGEPVTPVGAFNPGERPVTARIQAPVPGVEEGPALLGRQQLSSAKAGGRGVARGEIAPGPLVRVEYQVSGARAIEVVRSLLSDILGRRYVIENALEVSNQLVSLEINDEMTAAEAYALAQDIAGVYGWVLDDRDGTVFVRDNSGLKRAAAPIVRAQTALNDQTVVARVLRSRYVSLTDLGETIKAGNLLSPGGLSIVSGRTLVLIDGAAQVNRVAEIIEAMDVAAMENASVSVYQLVHLTGEDAETTLSKVLQSTKLGDPTDPTVAVAAIPKSRKLIVFAREPGAESFVRAMLDQIDRPGDSGQRFRYIYRVQNMEPDELANLVAAFHQDRVAGVVAAVAGGATGGAGGPEEGRARLVVNDKERLILIHATPRDYAEILTTLNEVDRPRQQVALDGVIAEVNLTGALQFGVQYFLNVLDKDGLGTGQINLNPGTLGSSATTGAFFTAGDGFAIVQALKQEGDVQILSQPKLTVRDGDKGRIQVGGEVPIVKGDVDVGASSDGTTGIRRAIEYRKTGVIFEVQPEINESGEVRLVIKQEITDVGQQTELGPEFTTRTLDTTVIVPHGRTVVLGGIISNTVRDVKRKIPLLGDIPGLGAAFTRRTNDDSRVELMLALTPRILNTPADTAPGTSEFLKAARTIRARLSEIGPDLAAPFREQVEALRPGVPAGTPGGAGTGESGASGAGVEPGAEAPAAEPVTPAAGTTPTGVAAR